MKRSHGCFFTQICIRSRAVIITEIYCKALRRRDLSGAVAARSVAPTDDKSGSEDASKPKTEAVEANITNLVGVDAFFICKHQSSSHAAASQIDDLQYT
jgi:hypothetical protein